jgi:hypothetical protein
MNFSATRKTYGSSKKSDKRLSLFVPNRAKIAPSQEIKEVATIIILNGGLFTYPNIQMILRNGS